VRIFAATADRTVRRRQILLACLLLASVLLIAFLGAVLYESKKPAGLLPTGAPAKTVPLTTPGGALDPRDAWRGAEGAAIEEIRRQLSQVTDDLKRIRHEREQERLQEKQRAERDAALGALAPPRPSAAPKALEPPLLPPPPAPAVRAPTSGVPPGKPPLPPLPGDAVGTAAAPGIFRLSLVDPLGGAVVPAAGKTALGRGATPVGSGDTAHAATPRSAKTNETYLPSTAFMRAVLLSGLDAPTGGQAQNNPHPVLLRVLDHAQLPNSFRSDVKDCFILGSGYGDLSSERAYVRTESLACIREGGDALDIPLKGVLVGPDGKAGVRGRLVSKTGQVLANALIAGLVSGLGTALTSGAIVQSVSPLGATQTVDPDKALQAGIGQGLARGLDRLVQYYISLADKIYPVVEVDAGQVVDVVVTRGVSVVAANDLDPKDRRGETSGGKDYFTSARR
jgi:conjugal transfer pilus assembly protein TraB